MQLAALTLSSLLSAMHSVHSNEQRRRTNARVRMQLQLVQAEVL